jgi:aspartate aminotransferase-like enzyme
MKLFTVGPVQSCPETLELGAKQLPYFRTDEFSDKMLNMGGKLKLLTDTDQSSKTAFLTASGSGAMEAAVINVFTEKDRVLIISGGTFGQRFEEICRIYGVPFDSVKLPFGEALTAEHLNRYKSKDYTGMLVNIHETSTGQLYDINLLSDFCKAKNMYLVVDAISSFLSDEYSMNRYGIDLTILSSQKGLAIPPGISAIIANDKIVNEKIMKNSPKTLYFNLKDYFKDFERGQTPYTPAVGILLQMEQRVNMIYSAGLDACIENSRKLANDFRVKVSKENLGLIIPDYPLSNTLTPLICKDNNAKFIFRELKNKYDIFITPNGGNLADRVLRVGHLGYLSIQDNDLLITKLKEVVC